MSIRAPGKGSFLRSYGTSNIGTGRPLRPGGHYRIASVTKTFVATAIPQLADRGRLRLDDRPSKYVAGVPNGDTITIRQLLGMRAGVFDWLDDPQFIAAYNADPLLPRWRPEDLIGVLRRNADKAQPPGQTPAVYSDSNYILLGLIIERVTHRSAERYIERKVVRPLGLRETSFPAVTTLPRPFSYGYDDTRTFTKLVRRLESNPARTTVADPATGQPTPVVLDGGALANWLVGMSFYTPSFKDVPSWIAQLAAGDPQSIATLRLAQVTPPGFVGYGLTYGVICSEWVPFDSEREVLAQGRDVLPRYPRSVLAQPPQFTYMFDDCRVWDVPAAPALVREPTVSEIPTLILSGSFDSVASLAWAYAAAETLPNSRIASIPGVGHFVAPESPCAQSIIASFLLQPDTPDTNCIATLRPPIFVTP